MASSLIWRLSQCGYLFPGQLGWIEAPTTAKSSNSLEWFKRGSKPGPCDHESVHRTYPLIHYLLLRTVKVHMKNNQSFTNTPKQHNSPCNWHGYFPIFGTFIGGGNSERLVALKKNQVYFWFDSCGTLIPNTLIMQLATFIALWSCFFYSKATSNLSSHLP